MRLTHQTITNTVEVFMDRSDNLHSIVIELNENEIARFSAELAWDMLKRYLAVVEPNDFPDLPGLNRRIMEARTAINTSELLGGK